jgi:hypothetical protein
MLNCGKLELGEEGNNKTYNLVLQISGLMTQLGNAWQELARSVQDSSLSKY